MGQMTHKHTTSRVDAEVTFKPEPEHLSHRATPIFISHHHCQTIGVCSLFIRNPVANLTTDVQEIEAIKAPSCYQTLGFTHNFHPGKKNTLFSNSRTVSPSPWEEHSFNL